MGYDSQILTVLRNIYNLLQSWDPFIQKIIDYSEPIHSILVSLLCFVCLYIFVKLITPRWI